jgi:hypothetical protein
VWLAKDPSEPLLAGLGKSLSLSETPGSFSADTSAKKDRLPMDG